MDNINIGTSAGRLGVLCMPIYVYVYGCAALRPLPDPLVMHAPGYGRVDFRLFAAHRQSATRPCRVAASSFVATLISPV